ncbi:DUF3298 and DUF4163 domain-containing protein [Tepidanaerobacter syntrophicus]|uniref:DUF3298 domain-containing protein n=1 Tax=Tepidanaerobacter syntrophicus TaxID=224999 RepID=A0A0U9HGT6_9FIRM|nr:DUF3298 and DUF4163 domain-containing protein [Tepidanaerobacter syntrophicus]GAQ25898.1 hypothetical protein TSYNT_9148 [Tepidanaerobacter syntrophicus]
MEKGLKGLKNEYLDIPIPEELDFVVRKAIKENRSLKPKERSSFKKTIIAAASALIIMATVTVGINTSPAFAETLSKVPIVGGIVKVLTFKEYTLNDETFNADIKIPEISGLKDEELQKALNEKYLEENEKLYQQFINDMEEMKKSGGGHLGVDSGYVIKTDNDRILSVGRYVVNTVASSSTTFKYDTIDKKNEVLITLPSLFKDDSYINIISENIKEQMIKRHKEDENMIYWVSGVEDEDLIELFEKISKDQNFYINNDGKLVICFDKYEVAPGYMGVQEFIIPTEVISNVLVSNEYIK